MRALICAVMLLAVVPACQRTYHENVFILPDGYRGRLVVVLAGTGPPAFSRHGYQRIYRFTDTGVICVRSFDNFTAGRGRTVAQYSGGAAIEHAPAGLEQEFDDTRFQLLGQAWSSTRMLADGSVITLSDPMLLAVVGNAELSRSVWAQWHDSPPGFIREQCDQPP